MTAAIVSKSFAVHRRTVRQLSSFAAIGIASTLAYVAIYAWLRQGAPAGVANAFALVVTAVANTAANRQVTFGVRGRGGLARDHAAGLVALGVALALTSASLAALDAIAPRHTRVTEVAVLVAANVAATLIRFLLLRFALLHRSPARRTGLVPPKAGRARASIRYPLDVGKDTRMTAIARPAFIPRFRPAEALRALVRGNADEAAWVRPAFAGVLALAAVLYIWNLTVSGYANTYYSAAALSASKSWSAWFFGSFDASNFITVDKPPLSTMLMGLSVRVFGLSSWSILLPEALAGVATVGVLFLAVKRSFGPAAATIAAAVTALTPAAVLIFRFNNPDALLTLLLVVSAWALLRSLENGSYRWMALAATCVGLAFLTKYLQAYLVLPGYALVFGFSANTTLRRRIVGLGVAMATVLVTSGLWVAIVELLPAGSKPFIGGSTTGSALDLIFGYDGLGRIFGSGGPGGGAGGGGGFSGDVGLLRLFNDQLFGQIAWLVPLALVCLVVGLFRRRWSHRTDPALAGYLLWGSWFIVTAIVFSYMSGIIHSYYAVALAPAIGALVGAGLVDLWNSRWRIWLGGIGVGLVCLGSAWFGATLLDRTPTFDPGLGPVAIVLAAVALLALVAASLPAIADRPAVKRIALAAASLGVVATLLAPAAYALDTTGIAYGGGDPHPGPGTTSGFSGFGGGAPGAPGLAGGFPGGPGGLTGGTPIGAGGGLGVDSALIDYLVANRGTATWIVAMNSAQEAGTIEITTGLPVMAMGGFTGSDPAPTLDQLKNYVASGKLRFILAGGGLGGGGFGGGPSDTTASDRSAWLSANCKLVSGVNSQLYDCAGAA